MKLCGLLTILVGLLLAPQRDIERPFPTKRHTRLLEYEREVVDMAIIRWISQDGAWDAGGSWSTGSVPGAGDTAIFDGVSQRSVTSGYSAIELKDLVTRESYSGDLGIRGNPLAGSGANGLITHRGSGTLYLNQISTTFIIIDSPNTLLAAELDFGSGINHILLVKSGRVEVTDGTTGLHLIVDQRGSVPATIEATHVTGVEFRYMFVDTGTIIGSFIDDSTGGAVQSIIGIRSGVIHFNSLEGALAQLRQWGGRVSFGPNRTAGQSLALVQQFGGTLDVSGLSETYTFTNFDRFGGEFIDSAFLTIDEELPWFEDYPDF